MLLLNLLQPPEQGISCSVGGDQLHRLSGTCLDYLYGDLGATGANVLVGLVSALVDNIPVIYAILSVDPEMSHG
jgi:hypothetical protein